MKKVRVNLKDRSYGIHIGKHALDSLSSFLNFVDTDTPFFVVTNRKVNRLHGAKLKKVLNELSDRILYYSN